MFTYKRMFTLKKFTTAPDAKNTGNSNLTSKISRIFNSFIVRHLQTLLKVPIKEKINQAKNDCEMVVGFWVSVAQLCGPLVVKISDFLEFLIVDPRSARKTGQLDILTSKTIFFLKSWSCIASKSPIQDFQESNSVTSTDPNENFCGHFRYTKQWP